MKIVISCNYFALLLVLILFQRGIRTFTQVKVLNTILLRYLGCLFKIKSHSWYK